MNDIYKCDFCDEDGYVPLPNDPNTRFICDRCYGKKALDWVDLIVPKEEISPGIKIVYNLVIRNKKVIKR